MTEKIRWIFFDVGTTLVDETNAYEHRIKDAVAGTDITFEQFQEKRIFFEKQNLRGDIEALAYFGLEKPLGIKRMNFPIHTPRRFCAILPKRGTSSALSQISP